MKKTSPARHFKSDFDLIFLFCLFLLKLLTSKTLTFKRVCKLINNDETQSLWPFKIFLSSVKAIQDFEIWALLKDKETTLFVLVKRQGIQYS